MKLRSMLKGRSGAARWIAGGAFAFFLIKGLIWLAIFVAAAWSAYRFS